MEWSLNVNDMFRDEITKITNSLLPDGFEGDVRSIRDYNVSYRLMQESVARVVDALGAQSAAAQGLSKVITTADRLRTADDHTLYLYKDANAQQGRGEVVGLLKVARKHLFLADEEGRVRELEPLCVLDFFVLPAYQRHGVGRALFDHMLQAQGTEARRLAVDGPSACMASFLRRQYGVPRLLRQNNNFAVAPAFFDDLPPDTSGRAGGGGALAAAGRYSAPKPHSSIANVIHGGAAGARSNGSLARDVDWRPQPAAQLRSTTSFCEESAASPPAPAPAAPAAPAAPGAHGSSPPRPRTLPVSAAPPPAAAAAAPPAAAAAADTPTPAGAPSRRDSQLTDKGFFDVKFYHKKLW